MKIKSQPTSEFIPGISDLVDICFLLFVEYGRDNEDKVADMFVQKMHEEGNTAVRVADVDSCVNPSTPHFGASLALDRIVFYLISNDKFEGLEIKN